MAVEIGQSPHETLARAAKSLAAGLGLRESLQLVAAAAAEAAGADAAVVHLVDGPSGTFVVRAAAPAGSPLAAELVGSRVTGEELERRLELEERLLAPVFVGDRLVGALELVGAEPQTRDLLDLATAQLALALRRHPELDGDGAAQSASTLERVGEALAAGATLGDAAQHAAWAAATATGASVAAVWRADQGLELLATSGPLPGETRERAAELAAETLTRFQPLAVTDPQTGTHILSIQLGQPTFGVLQLVHDAPPRDEQLDALAAFAVRAAHALREGERAREVELELERTRALLSVVGDAIARLSLAHTLETALERVGELLGLDRVGIYLREGAKLLPAAGRGLSAGHEDIALSLQELALGPLRARDTIEVRAGARDRLASGVRRTLRDSGLDAVIAVPLRVHDESIGLLVAYPGTRRLEESERRLVASLASQLAVAVQNAVLHEQAKELGDALRAALDAERSAAKRLAALYEISRSFAQSLSLDATLDAVAKTIVDVLGVDAAVIRTPSERDTMAARAIHVADERIAGPVRAVLEFPQARVLRSAQPMLLDAPLAAQLGGSHALLAPFLEQGSTAAAIPIASPSELLALLTIVSLDADRPITEETVATATTIAAQASLAIDNARLYQQQQAFAETIQRALLPRDRPQVPGLELGAVYESAARVDVGGDVYDFVELPGDRLAVVVGDVTGHGIDATADMAMAKFVFRSLSREHPEPGEFLAHANEVVAGEIELGKFITLSYLAVDREGALACASAGHPPPRLVLPEGGVQELACGGLALGIAPGQSYAEAAAFLPAGAAVVLYTDGVVEVRRDGELYGVERLDAFLSAHRGLSAQRLAESVLADCRAFGGGELSDDCAVVVVKRA
ncbi:MAG: SpoIIE family protein phosphatase [Actinobacteria bacterium]|nr:SpoIIE family protein phosphatase [Actinomycetota bacterium]